MMGPLSRYRALSRGGVLGINQRNSEFVLPSNQRRDYPCVDDKLLTRDLATAAGIPVPTLLGKVSYHHELQHLPRMLEGLRDFVLKPARGSQGNGIVVITDVHDGVYRKSSGRLLTHTELRQHVSSTISGVFSLRGDLDSCAIEARVVIHESFEPIARFGIPDIRVIVYRGIPVMSMSRLPTVESDGRANLHQGAIAAGLDLATGVVLYAAHRNRPVTHHVDTHAPIIGHRVPHWETVLELAARASDISGLGYIGVDLVIDANRGPLLLELNARPGLMIQVANRQGLLPRLRQVQSLGDATRLPWKERCTLARSLFGESGS
jgi:alpha-L-glutamate ligase-like protein